MSKKVESQSSPRLSEDDVVAKISALNESWLVAAKARDLDGMMAIYDTSAQELLPGMPAIIGIDAIRTFYGNLITTFPRFSHWFAPDSAMVSESRDLVVMRGGYCFTPDTIEPQRTMSGKYVGVWRCFDGKWRLVLNISNSNGADSVDQPHAADPTDEPRSK